jgi:hypothetical protein
MKKIVLFVALLGALMLGLTSNVKAQTTIYCKLDISSDTCNGGGYKGSYDVTVELWINGGGSPVCTATGTTTSGLHCVALTGPCTPNGSICTYYEVLTNVQRSNGTCGITPNTPSAYVCWSFISTCNIYTPQFYVTL